MGTEGNILILHSFIYSQFYMSGVRVFPEAVRSTAKHTNGFTATTPSLHLILRATYLFFTVLYIHSFVWVGLESFQRRCEAPQSIPTVLRQQPLVYTLY